MDENEAQASLRPKETADEKISLSDRFGLWLGFYNCNQNEYLEMIDGYIKEYDLKIEQSLAHKEALNWSITRGARSGRVASQYISDLAGRLKVKF
jgi:predicted AAA+ superfamily ATPase